MDLTKISNSELGARLLKLARTERKITHLVLWHVLEFQTRKIYLDMGYSSMITYLVKHLGYCETSARNRLNAAQLLRKAPEVVEKIESGSINLSQLNQVQRHIRYEQDMGRSYSASQTQELLQKLENQNTFETQKTLAVAFDFPLKLNTITKPQKDNSVRIEMTFTEAQFAELKKARQILAHVCPDGHWPDVITELAKKFNRSKLGKDKVLIENVGALKTRAPAEIQKNLRPVKAEERSTKLKIKARPASVPNSVFITQSKTEVKAKSKTELESEIKGEMTAENQTKNKIQTTSQTRALEKAKSTSMAKSAASRPYISVKIKRALLAGANHQCEFINSNTRTRCDARHALQIDHRLPLALGGSHEVENLRVLCRSHNQMMARKHGLFRKTKSSKKILVQY